MLEKLTKEQEERLIEYRDKWLKIGLNTDRIDFQVGKYISDYYYSKLEKKPIVPVVILSSPLYAWVAVCMMNQVENQVSNQVWNQVRNQVWNQVRNQVSNQVWNQVGNQVRNQVGYFVWPYLDGSFMSSYFSFYDYCNDVLNIKYENQEYFDWYKKTSEVGLMYPLENICIISDRPEIINMKDGILHCDGGPSIKYIDGFSVWSLNGVSVTKEIAETPHNKLDPKLILKESNAEVRREIVRKIGIERICEALHSNCIDKQDNYELLMLDLQDGRIRPYLKMRNPSIGVYHIEGVHPDCNTVEKALNWRNGTKDKPLQLT